ncbi:hypothetical protein PENTCL1PPCAC_23490, partial [Pristionchus entomophagus]
MRSLLLVGVALESVLGDAGHGYGERGLLCGRRIGRENRPETDRIGASGGAAVARLFRRWRDGRDGQAGRRRRKLARGYCRDGSGDGGNWSGSRHDARILAGRGGGRAFRCALRHRRWSGHGDHRSGR